MKLILYVMYIGFQLKTSEIIYTYILVQLIIWSSYELIKYTSPLKDRYNSTEDIRMYSLIT